ncbi:hypothetical protein J6590_103825 [Homalodisca vitripennis]|nr:hypothetical protein J6590_103825 [Homalodisca vitripennis]
MSKLLKIGWHIVLQWIPSHSGGDDDKADKLAMQLEAGMTTELEDTGRIGVYPTYACPLYDHPKSNTVHLLLYPGFPANLSTEDDILKETTHFYWSARHLMVNLPTVVVRWLVRNSFITSVPLYPSHDPEYTVNRLDT